MISRRLIRVKILQVLYAYMKAGKALDKAEKELLFSIDKVLELYYYFLLLIVEIAYFAQSRIDIAKQKKVPTYEDLHPNTKFVDNEIVNIIANDEALKAYIDNKNISWSDYPELIKKLYQSIISTVYYNKYMLATGRSIQEDKKIIESIIVNEFSDMELLDSWMEEKSIYWNDDLNFILAQIIKNIKQIKNNKDTLAHTEVFKNKEDKDFAISLFRKMVVQNNGYKELINNHTKNWDVERIAFMDILLMEMAITEIVEFPSIPVKVSLNEYIEISKSYSTRNSSNFINGILDKILKVLREENKIVKKGRGLVGEE